MLWCIELDTAENFGLTSIQKPFIAISKCPLLNIHPVDSRCTNLTDIFSTSMVYKLTSLSVFEI